MSGSRRGIWIRVSILCAAVVATMIGASMFATQGLSGEDTGGANFLFWSGLVVTVLAALSLLYEWGRRRADRAEREPSDPA